MTKIEADDEMVTFEGIKRSDDVSMEDDMVMLRRTQTLKDIAELMFEREDNDAQRALLQAVKVRLAMLEMGYQARVMESARQAGCQLTIL